MAVLDQDILLQIRVDLDLVAVGLDAAESEHIVDQSNAEVGDADVAN